MMRRLLLILLMAIGILGFGAIAWSTLHPAPAARSLAARPTAHALVAARALAAGTLLRSDDITTRLVEAEAVRPDEIDSPSARARLVGAAMRQAVQPASIFSPALTIRPDEHGFLVAVLRPGMQAMTLKASELGGDAGTIEPGDRLDLLLIRNLASESGAGGASPWSVSSELIVSDVRVIALDGGHPEPGAEGPRTLTLEVKAADSPRLAVAMQLGRLTFVIRGHDGAAAAVSGGVTWAGNVTHAFPPKPSLAAVAVRIRVLRGAQTSVVRF